MSFLIFGIILMTYTAGGSIDNTGDTDLILKFNKDNNTWDTVGNMLMERSFHAISVVPLNDIIDYCN